MKLQVKCSYSYSDTIPDFYQTKFVDAKYVTDGLKDEIKNSSITDAAISSLKIGFDVNEYLKAIFPRSSINSWISVL